MKPSRKLSRRSFLARVAGGAALLPLLPNPARAQATDSDTGPSADAAGQGRGVTDSDSGFYADPAGHGRGAATDSDTGRYADPPGAGRGRRRRACSGLTDSDGGGNADPAGCGRGRQS